MLAAIGIKTNPAAVDKVRGGSMPATLPRSLDEYLRPNLNPAQGALSASAALLFLAMQAPREWRAADRLFTKAWVALDSVDDVDPAVRRLRARILLHLYERPYALSLISNDTGPEADGLRAVLNGNLPQARQALAQVRSPWEKFFLGIEVVDLELGYSRDSRASTRQVLGLFEGSPFAPFVYRRLLERDGWSLTKTRDMISILDSAIPQATNGVLAVLRAAFAAESNGPDAELASIRQVHRLIEEQPHLWCCASFSTDPRASDLLDMLDSRIEHTLLRQAYYSVFPQSQYHRALEILDSYDDELAGNPHAESMRALIYGKLIDSGELEQREERTVNLHAAARLAAWLDQAQTSDSYVALLYMDTKPEDPTLQSLVRVSDDYPLRPYWRDASRDNSTKVERLVFSTDDAGALMELLDTRSGDARSGYLQELAARFRGGQAATNRRMKELPPSLQNPPHYRAEIEADPDNWEIYRTLAQLQLQEKAYADVQRTILTYPPFMETRPNDPVALSNWASEWGHKVLWQGAIDEAQPLLEKAAGYNTGSDRGGWAAARLALLHARYPDAAESFLEIGGHYHDLTAYRELVSLQFAAGQDSSAWSLFGKLTDRYKTTGFWTAAMVGHRRANMSPSALGGWYADRLNKVNAGANRDDLRQRAFLEQIIDRELGADLPGIMQSLATGSDVAVHADGRIYSMHASDDNSAAIGPSEFGKQRHQKLTLQSRPPDRYVVATEALLALQAGKYPEAMSKFDELSANYSIERDWMLPYFAYSAAKAGDSVGLSTYLEGVPSESKQRFEVTLARAVFAALAGKSADARALLESDAENWAYFHTDHFPHSAYQYINVCALLYEATGDQLYREAALRMSRLVRRIEPAFAYGHAAVAYLSTDAKEQVHALATALYLDPQSRWARKASSSLQAAAQASLAHNGNPFARGYSKKTWWEINIGTAAFAD
jgi:hypothetical protein